MGNTEIPPALEVMTMKPVKKPADKPLSLTDMTPEQALFKALNTPPPKKKAAKKRDGMKK